MKTLYTFNFTHKGKEHHYANVLNFEITPQGYLFLKFEAVLTKEIPGEYSSPVMYFDMKDVQDLTGDFRTVFETEKERTKFEENLNGE